MAFKQDSAVTLCILRRWPDNGRTSFGGIIALFPMLPGTNDPATCDSYEHVGQHGAADPAIVADTLPVQADEPEAVELVAELESAPYGYRLKLGKRVPRNAYDVRRSAINSTKG